MDWPAQVFRYCERGIDPGLWAEPLNAISNAAFVVVGMLALAQFSAAPRGTAHRRAGLCLAAIVVAIGVGSFLFHTFATQWAQVADTAPIGLFMVAYLGFALRVFLGLSWPMTVVGLAAFIMAMWAVAGLDCGWLAAGVRGGSPGRCFNGTLGYAPALAALAAVGGMLLWRAQAPAGKLLAATAVLAISMALRTIDLEICDATRVAGHVIGTHFLWHALNAVALHLMLVAVREH